ncbi:hypothetical protein FRC12_008060 [Ceratobasidium sp. 428]|nr:hypothetical protein FRC12_008060 [Ceratobasidium sp. 428]
MGCSTTIHAGIPLVPPPLSRLLATVKLKWGLLAVLHLDELDFLKSGLPEPLLRFLCRDKHIFEAGLNSAQMIKDLSVWRWRNRLIKLDGAAVNPGRENAVAVAKAEYFLSCARKEVTSLLETNFTMPVIVTSLK